MKLVIVEKQWDRVERIYPGLSDKIERIIVCQTEVDFTRSIHTYRHSPFIGKITREYPLNMGDLLDMYEKKDEFGRPRYVFLFNMCPEDEHVPFGKRFAVDYIGKKEESAEQPRCFVYTTCEQMQQKLNSRFKARVVNTDLGQDHFLLWADNPLLCKALSN